MDTRANITHTKLNFSEMLSSMTKESREYDERLEEKYTSASEPGPFGLEPGPFGLFYTHKTNSNILSASLYL